MNKCTQVFVIFALLTSCAAEPESASPMPDMAIEDSAPDQGDLVDSADMVVSCYELDREECLARNQTGCLSLLLYTWNEADNCIDYGSQDTMCVPESTVQSNTEASIIGPDGECIVISEGVSTLPGYQVYQHVGCSCDPDTNGLPTTEGCDPAPSSCTD